MGGFLSALMGGGGPSREMKENSAQQQSLANTFMANYSQLYGENQEVLGQLKRSLTPLIAAGPGQQGFTSPVLAALNSQAINGAGAANRNARQAVANFGAGRASDSGLTSGVQKQLEASVASNSSNQLANAQNEITQKNYETGRQNYFSALGGEEAMAGFTNPNGAGSLANSELTSSFNSSTKINDEVNAQKAARAGAIASLAMDVGTFGLGGIANLGAGESLGEGFGDFFKGGVGALSGGQ